MRFKQFFPNAPNWRARILPSRKWTGGVLPQELQTALPTDYNVQLEAPSGVAQPALIEAGADFLVSRQPQRADDTRLSWYERIWLKIGRHPQKLTNYRVEVGTVDVVCWPYNAFRAYTFMVNTGAATIFISFDRAADAVNGIPIPPGGFFEPILGCTSSLHALSTVAAQSLVVCEGFYDGA